MSDADEDRRMRRRTMDKGTLLTDLPSTTVVVRSSPKLQGGGRRACRAGATKERYRRSEAPATVYREYRIARRLSTLLKVIAFWRRLIHDTRYTIPHVCQIAKGLAIGRDCARSPLPDPQWCCHSASS